MGWFNKKEKKENEVPELPALPKLPELPGAGRNEIEPITKLPSFPNNNLGEKFSQSTIKNAIAGREEENAEEDDYEMSMAKNMTQEPMQFPLTREISPMKNYKPSNIDIDELPALEPRGTKNREPIFVRLDRFEESVKLFDEIRNQVAHAERFLEQTKHIKEQEEEELNAWEEELQLIKNQIERINRDIFSKVD